MAAILKHIPLTELLAVAIAAEAMMVMDEAHLAAATSGKDMTPKQFDLFDLSQALAALFAKLPKENA